MESGKQPTSVNCVTLIVPIVIVKATSSAASWGTANGVTCASPIVNGTPAVTGEIDDPFSSYSSVRKATLVPRVRKARTGNSLSRTRSADEWSVCSCVTSDGVDPVGIFANGLEPAAPVLCG